MAYRRLGGGCGRSGGAMRYGILLHCLRAFFPSTALLCWFMRQNASADNAERHSTLRTTAHSVANVLEGEDGFNETNP